MATNSMTSKTKEERSAIAAKAHATAKRNRDERIRQQNERMEHAGFLSVKIKELTQKLEKLELAEAMNTRAMELSGKSLLLESEIIAASKPWRNTTGVYFLVKGDAVVYVGQALSVFQRIGQHADKDFDAVAFVPCPAAALDRLESLYIHVLRPRLNASFRNGAKFAPIDIDKLLRL